MAFLPFSTNGVGPTAWGLSNHRACLGLTGHLPSVLHTLLTLASFQPHKHIMPFSHCEDFWPVLLLAHFQVPYEMPDHQEGLPLIYCSSVSVILCLTPYISFRLLILCTEIFISMGKKSLFCSQLCPQNLAKSLVHNCHPINNCQIHECQFKSCEGILTVALSSTKHSEGFSGKQPYR